VTDVLSAHVQEVETLGVTGEHEPFVSVSPKVLHTCCCVAVAGLETEGLFQYAIAYSAPARVAPFRVAAVFINIP
jgi:hypothetical protein